MENSGIIFLEAVIVANDAEEELVVLGQVSCGGQQPAIAEFSLLHVEARISLDEELRIVADLHWTQPLIATVGATRVEQTLVSARELGIFKESARVEALLANGVKILNIGLTAQSTGLFSDLKWTKFDFN